MGLRETEQTTEMVLARMENSLNSMEQMAFDSINITDKLLMRINMVREHVVRMAAVEQEKEKAYDSVFQQLDELLETAFLINNVAHELEKESSYQRDTTEKISQIIEFLYAMADKEDTGSPD